MSLNIIVAEQLKDEIIEALLNRPTPTGKPYSDLAEATLQQMNEIQTALCDIEVKYNELLCLFELKPQNIAAEISTQSTTIEQNIHKWIEIYHGVWERPFPKRDETLQTLLAAIPEKVLRDILGHFQQVLKILEDPNQAVKDFGSDTITLELTINLDRESEMLAQYKPTYYSGTQDFYIPPVLQTSLPNAPKFRLLGTVVLIISLLFIYSLFASGYIVFGFTASLILLILTLSEE